jgi:hypothetical protein
MRRRLGALALTLVAGLVPPGVGAHSGPPFPIVTGHRDDAYVISIWTDPDATDDGSAGGQFWVVLHAADAAKQIPSDTRVTLIIQSLDRPGPTQTAVAGPVNNDHSRRFASLLMDHEGRFAVRVTVDGPLGPATVASTVEATYDLRPSPLLLVVYLLPFLLTGALWTALLLRRRDNRRSRPT